MTDWLVDPLSDHEVDIYAIGFQELVRVVRL